MSNTLTFEYNGARITVRAETGHDYFEWRRIIGLLNDAGYDEKQWSAWVTFAAMCSRTVSVEGDIGVTWPPALNNVEQVRAAYAAVLGLRSNLIVLWEQALLDVNRQGAPDLGPASDVPLASDANRA